MGDKFDVMAEAVGVRGDNVQNVIVANLLRRVDREAREECARLHEQIDVSDGREPMAVVIEYRDKIRGSANG